MYPPSQAAYDRAITVFSPDGRLFQVEYAREAVKTGSTSIGAVGRDCVVLVAEKRIPSKLIVGKSHEKIFQIDKHIAASSSGLVADARKLIDSARLEAQKYRVTYNEQIDVETLAKNIGDYVQMYTQYAGVRPFGVSLLVAGIDAKAQLFEIDPSGALFEYKATAIGSGRKGVEEFMEKNYKENLSRKELLKLCTKALQKVSEKKLTSKTIDAAIIERPEKKVKILGDEEIDAFLKTTK